ncbi:hypothetical protein [Halovivax cerinus]|uniref:Uncharacterized protein n=1 Tax=Halovivax cerinus TaxID=1487865 RepID=A0ABD5NLF7_9EURY|nr:hypothetical protein [Halovivax cerinus]
MSTNYDTPDSSTDTDTYATDGAGDVSIDVTFERPFYDLIRLELEDDRLAHETVEEFVRAAAWFFLTTRHKEHEQEVEALVGVSEDIANRLVLRAKFEQESKGKDPETAWYDTVDSFIQVAPVLEDPAGKDVRDRFDGGADGGE